MAAADEQNQARIKAELAAAAKAEADAAARQKRMDDLQAEREKRMADEVKARGASDPMRNPAVRPEAAQTEPGYVQYYSWIGGATTGSWRLYKTPADGPMAASATARSTGGVTQATGASAVGANVLSNNQSGFTGKKEVSRKTNPDGSITITYSDGTTSVIPAPGGNQNVYKGSGTTGDPLTLNGLPFTGTYNGKTYSNGVIVTTNNNNNGASYSGSGTAGDPLMLNGKAFNGVLGGVTYNNGVAQSSGLTESGTLTATDIETKARRTAQQDFKAALGELGLADLADEVDRMIKLDYTVSQIKMELPKSESYKQRFPGMAALRAAGRTINEATYISNERGYLQTLRAFGLDTATLGSRTELGKYIANEVSPREFEERVNIAATRVKENPDVTAAFKSFYPEVDESGVIAYLLNPTKGMDIIRKQIRISEIGAASQVAGFGRDIMGVDQAAALISAVGDTGYGALRTEFQRARQLATTQRRLAQIEGQGYSDLEAIGAVVGDDVTKALASERRASRETARFGGRGGLTGGSLSRQAGI
jgi:hypothetical protein